MEVQSAVAHGAAGVFTITDGQEDQHQCLCKHTFIFGPSKAKMRQAMEQAQIPKQVEYTCVPIWAYACPLTDLRVQRDGTMQFIRAKSQIPCLRILVSNFTDNVEGGMAAHQGWRGNALWQAQVSLARQRLSQAARSDLLLTPDKDIPTMMMCPLLDRAGDGGRDGEVDSAPFWEDSRMWYLRSPSRATQEEDPDQM